MDYGLGVNMKSRSGRKKRSSGKEDVKVVYISSPMKVKTSAAEFRALVQELTGKDSDTARLMEARGNQEVTTMMMKKATPTTPERSVTTTTTTTTTVADHDDDHCNYRGAFCGGNKLEQDQDYSASTSSEYSGSLETFEEQVEGMFLPMEGSFMSLFQPNFWTEFGELEGLN